MNTKIRLGLMAVMWVAVSACGGGLKGTWESACDNNGDGTSEKEQLVFEDDTWENKELNFAASADCSGSSTETSQAKGTYEEGGDSEAVDGATNLNFTVTGSNPVYTIYKIDDDKLFTGTSDGTNNGTTEALRHRTLDTTDFFTKK